MEENKKYNRQLEINDLIDDAITNAVTRRELVETLCDEEAASVGGGLTAVKEPYTVADFKPICPPLIVGLIYVPEDNTQLLSS